MNQPVWLQFMTQLTLPRPPDSIAGSDPHPDFLEIAATGTAPSRSRPNYADHVTAGSLVDREIVHRRPEGSPRPGANLLP